MQRLATTPFGGAPMRAQTFARQRATEARQQTLKDGAGGNDAGVADKWALLRALTHARLVYGLSDRTLAVLEGLVSFNTDRMLDGRAPIIVFPSNAELSLRTRGMSGATLRRHLALLVEAGLIFRRDSANGKRYCRRDDRGQVEDAFGFDLAPLALASSEIHAHAEAAIAQARRIDRLRAEITLHLRDISKIIASAIAEGRGGDWDGFAGDLASLSGRVRRNEAEEVLAKRRDSLAELRARVEDTYLEMLSEQEMSASDSDSERHIQNSNTDLPFEIKGRDQNTAGPASEKPERRRPPAGVKLETVLACCPSIADYARSGISGWRDLVETAGLVRSMLGISPDAWAKAVTAMGEIPAAITLAAILERAEDIRSPGGYLRDLTRKAEAGRFSIQPMLKALGG